MKELLQRFLHAQGLYAGKFDGLLSPQTMQAINALLLKSKITSKGWDERRRFIAALQIMARSAGIDAGKVDGLYGPSTKNAMELYASKLVGHVAPTWRDEDIVASPPETADGWPAYRNLEKFYGLPGTAPCTAGKVKPPFKMVLAWDTGSEVKTITCHEKVADSLERVLKRVASVYSPEQIVDLGLHLFGGSFNKRLMRGGTQWSTHSWGIALDFDPMRNGLHTKRPAARLSRPDAEPFWKLWEAEHWLSLGRARNYDWMHVQACGL